MRTDHIAYPYWENMARYKEGRLMYVAFAQWNMAALLFILIFVNALVFVIRHKPTRQGLESAMDVIRRKRQAKHMERLMKETEDEKAAEAEAAKAEEAAAKAQEEVTIWVTLEG